jgi:V/A-type H+-transporting ATPase subunit E
MESDAIRQAVIDNARSEAQQIIEEANAEAQRLIQQETAKKEKKFAAAKHHRLSEARREAAKIEAQASLQAHQEILKCKDDLLQEIIRRVKDALSQNTAEKEALRGLIQEAIDALGAERKVRLLVAEKDLKTAKDVIDAHQSLAERILEVNTTDCMGGVMVIDADGLVDIDNTYETRLEMLLPQALPEIGSTLFGKTGE